MEAFGGRRIVPVTVLSQPRPKADEPPPDDAIAAFKHVLESIRRYKHFIVKMISAGALLAVLGSLFMSPSYLATAQLVVNARGGADSAGAPGNASAPTGGSDDPTIDTHVTVMMSDAYLRRLLPAVRLLDNPTQATAASSPLGAVLSKIKELLPFRKNQPSDSAAVAALKGHLKISQERRSRVISVIASDVNPQRAAGVANLVARSYVDELIRQRRTVELQALDAIASQSAIVQHDLSQAKEEWDASHSSQATLTSQNAAALEWKITTLAQQYETLLRKRQELTTKGVVADPDVTVIADASPVDLPSSLNPLLLVPPITIVVTLLACLIAVILKYLDRTLHTEAEATEALHIPCVGLIPSIPLELSSSPRRFLESSTTSHNRAVRSTVVSLIAADPVSPRSQHVVLVTSSLHGEGKSAVAWSFGFCAAQLGQRVLFLDFAEAPRRSSESLDLFKLVAHDGAAAKAVQHIPELGIDYISSSLSEGSRLGPLAGPRVASLFEHFRNSYDIVVINAPSLDEAPEVRLLASWADHVLLAVRAGSTSRDVVRSTLSRFDRDSDIDPGVKLWCVLTRGRPIELAPADAKPPSMSTFRLSYLRLKKAAMQWTSIAAAIHAPENAEPGWRPRK